MMWWICASQVGQVGLNLAGLAQLVVNERAQCAVVCSAPRTTATFLCGFVALALMLLAGHLM
jgi:hypothetical protein